MRYQSWLQFIRRDIWLMPSDGLSKLKVFLLKALKSTLAACYHFNEKEGNLKASALTYYTLLSIVPCLAALIAVARGFGLSQLFEETIIKQFAEQEIILNYSLDFAKTFLEQSSSGAITGFGTAFLLWSVSKMLQQIEASLNDIWGIKNARTWKRRFTDYLAMTLVLPICFVAATSVTVWVSRTQIGEISLYALPFLLTCFLFTVVYLFMPNGKIPIVSAVVGGTVAGITYQVFQWAYVAFLINLSRYNLVYGTYAAIPLFIMWVHMSWLILLAGAQVGYITAFSEEWEYKYSHYELSHRTRCVLSIAICHACLKKYQKEEIASNLPDLANELKLPIILVRSLLEKLCYAKILLEVKDGKKAYIPGIPGRKLTVKRIIDAIERQTDNRDLAQKNKLVLEIREKMKTLDDLVLNSPVNILVENLGKA
jgi:membrane protein